MSSRINSVVEAHVIGNLIANAPDAFGFFTRLKNAGFEFTTPVLAAFDSTGHSEESVWDWAESDESFAAMIALDRAA